MSTYNKNILVFVFLIFHLVGQAQERSLRNDASFVIGLEGSFSYHTFNSLRGGTPKVAYGVNVGYPIGKFSLGLGILRSHHGVSRYSEYTGQVISRMDYDGEQEDFYQYNYKSYDLQYTTVVNRIQFRLPCNCVFIEAGYKFSFLDKNTLIDSRPNETKRQPLVASENIDPKKSISGLDFGIGFNLFVSNSMRIVVKQTFGSSSTVVATKNHYKNSKNQFLSMTLGIQKGFL